MAVAMAVAAIWTPLANLVLAVNQHARYTYIYVLAALATLVVAAPASFYLGEIGAALSVLALDVFMLQHLLRLIFVDQILHRSNGDIGVAAFVSDTL
jgi:O-antigen/teichoic acid export membrane protein